MIHSEPPREWAVQVPGGHLAVLDHGGSGPDVLLVHSIGQTGALWDLVVPHLVPHAHVRSLDLRGHGRSTAELLGGTDLADTVDDLLTVVHDLSLRSPVLVGYDIGGRLAVEAALAAPELIGAVVPIDCSLVEPAEVLAEFASQLRDTNMRDSLCSRFALGVTGQDGVDLELFALIRAYQSLPDWMETSGNLDDAERRTLRSVRVNPDGSWERRPTRAAAELMASGHDRGPHGQGREILTRLRVPTRVVVFTEGHFGRLDAGLLQLVSGSEFLDIGLIEGNGRILDREPEEVAGQIRLAAAAAHDYERGAGRISATRTTRGA